MNVKITCPLGHTCEKCTDQGIERCAWYVKLVGKDPQTGQDVDEWRCSMAWQPILMIESNGAINRTNANIQSMRNDVVEREELAIKMVAGAIDNAKVITHK